MAFPGEGLAYRSAQVRQTKRDAAGRHVDYAAESLSLAILERLVHYKRFDGLEPHVLYELDVPESAIETVTAPPARWADEDPSPDAQAIGNAWCDEQRSPALRVPSSLPGNTTCW